MPTSDDSALSESGLPIKAVYDARDLDGWDAQRQLGEPGEYPFTRGVYPTMYTGRPWTMRQYAGFGTAAESNARYKQLLAAGTMGLSVAFDLPTQMGYDSDHPLAHGELRRLPRREFTLARRRTVHRRQHRHPHPAASGGNRKVPARQCALRVGQVQRGGRVAPDRDGGCAVVQQQLAVQRRAFDAQEDRHGRCRLRGSGQRGGRAREAHREPGHPAKKTGKNRRTSAFSLFSA